MAAGRSDNKMSEETFDYVCTSCAEDNIIKEGVSYCVECKSYCCTDCVSLHGTYGPLKRHSLLDTSNSQQVDQTSSLPSFPTERCSIHQGKVIYMYCGDHEVVGCCACIAIDHKNCSDVHSIPDHIDIITTDDQLNENVGNLQTETDDIESMLHQSNTVYMKKLDNAKEKSLHAITEQRREADSKLDRLETNSRSEVHSHYDKLKSRLMNANQRVEFSFNTYVNFGDKIKQAGGNKSQKFVCSKLFGSAIKKDQADMYKAETELDDFVRDGILSFDGDKSLIESLQLYEQLGVVTVNDKTRPYTQKHCDDINVKVSSDTNVCKIWGCCLFNDTTLLMTDRNNKKLKRVNLNKMQVEDYIDLPYNICGVCRCQDNEVAVACLGDNLIQLVNLGQTMTQSRQFKLNHRCYHVAYIDNKLCVSNDGTGSVCIFDMAGKLLQTISEDNSGNKLFTNSVQICASRDTIFVTAFGGGLVYLDKKGKHITTTKDTDIGGADGVCIDGIGNVFVAGRNTNNVVQFGYDGKKKSVVLNEACGLRKLRSICFHQKLSKLFVTMDENDTLKVFDLE